MKELSVSAGPVITGGCMAAAKSEKPVVAVLLLVVLVLGGLVSLDSGVRGALLFGLGLLLGVVFLAFQYGFASGWRAALEGRKLMPMAAHFMLASLCALAFIPLSSGGFSGWGLNASGSLAPLSLSLPLGAFMFGIGMQLANGCGSGVLFSFGGGSGRMLIALPCFVIGSLTGSFWLPAVLDWGQLPPVQIGGSLDNWSRLSLNLLLLGGMAGLLYGFARHRGEQLPPRLVVATLLIALLCVVVFMLAGHPWGVTFGFTLWGAKLAQLMLEPVSGIAVETWRFWQWPGPARALTHSVLADTSSLMNTGMLIGSALAAATAGRLRDQQWPPRRQLIAAALGGVLMGIGARFAFGCNIGAFLGGTASGSLHGWVWFGCALAGCSLGIRLRPSFGF